MSKYLFGPVPSRRLGRSLGIDLVPLKTCSYDCIYCQLGRTTCKTIERREWVPVDEVFAGLEEAVASRPDWITLSGSGEPTLHSRIGEVIERVKRMTDVPVAVLTNGSLLWQEDVRRQLGEADLVVPSLDAGGEDTFRRVNRPHEEVSFARMVEGLIELRREFRGEYWLEVLLVAEVTATPTEVERMARHVDRIRPDRVQLNTVTRPAVEAAAVAAEPRVLAELAPKFRPPGEIIAAFHGADGGASCAADSESILGLLRRRPCTLHEIAEGLGMHPNEVIKHVERLATEGRVGRTQTEGQWYYQALP